MTKNKKLAGTEMGNFSIPIQGMFVPIPASGHETAINLSYNVVGVSIQVRLPD